MAEPAVCGIDEAGRGPWAGPVVAAAVLLSAPDRPAGLADSKALTARQRAALYAQIMASARVGVGAASVAEIDRLNILQATLAAMALLVLFLNGLFISMLRRRPHDVQPLLERSAAEGDSAPE